MSVATKLETAMNELLTPVLVAMMEAGRNEDLQAEKREAAMLVVGLMTAIKVLVMQTGEIVMEMDLNDLME